MPDRLFNLKTPGHIRFLASFLIFALSSAPLGYAQQPQRPQTPQQRILVEGDQKTNTARPSGPRAARPELVLQTGVTAPAFNAIFSPDGRLLASMDGAAGSIKLWEVSTGRELHALNLGAHNLYTNAFNSPFIFSPDGSSIFSVSAGMLRQWDTRAGRQVRSADLNYGKDFSLAYFSADAQRLAAASFIQSSLAVWDVGSGRKLQELKLDVDNGERLLAFALSPDGRTLAINVEVDAGGGRKDVLTLRDAAGGRVIQTIKISEQRTAMAYVSTEAARGIRFTPDGRAVAVVFKDTTRDSSQVFSGGQPRVTGQANKIRIWDASSGRELIPLDAGAGDAAASLQMSYFGAPYSFAFSDDNRRCGIASGRKVKLFDPVTGRDLATVSGHDSDVVAVNFSAD